MKLILNLNVYQKEKTLKVTVPDNVTGSVEHITDVFLNELDAVSDADNAQTFQDFVTRWQIHQYDLRYVTSDNDTGIFCVYGVYLRIDMDNGTPVDKADMLSFLTHAELQK